jgi:HK97 family phage major capsid protein
MGQVSVSWGTAEGTAISLFNTDALITELAIPILACSAAIEWGKDFQADTPVADFGSMVVDEFGQAMLSEIDRVICEGNGTTEPEGFLTASGTISVNADNAATGPYTLGDFIETLFSVPLQYREQGLNGVFISNDTTFMRSRQIKVDPQASTTDQRPVMSTVEEVSRYTSLGYPHKISNTGMTNRQLVFLCAKKYRLYRRTGIETMLVDQDWTLARQNKRGFIIRSRMGGKLVDGNACAKIADGQS